ncbi:MAG: AtpZ/AtpI family protein [Hyphomicrobiales bacterium]
MKVREGGRKSDLSERPGPFAERLERARCSASKRARRGYVAGSAYELGLRVATEMVVAIAVGFVAGWYLDQWFGTKPLLIIAFAILGASAGVLNVMRTASLSVSAPKEGGEADTKPASKGNDDKPCDLPDNGD